MKKGDRVLLSDLSIEDAKTNGEKGIFLADVGGLYPIVAVYGHDENRYPDGKYDSNQWKYAVPIPKKKKRFLDPVKMMQFIVEELSARCDEEKGGWWICIEERSVYLPPDFWMNCGQQIPDSFDTSTPFVFDKLLWHPGMVEEYEE